MRNVLLALCSLVVAAGVIEIVLRSTHVFGARVSWTEPDPWVGWRFTPGREYWFFNENDHAITGRINSLGWRDRERARAKRAEVRIAVLGDSYVEAFQVEFDSTFVAVAERTANAREGRTCEFLNFGRSGMGPAEENIVLLRDVLPIAPDLVVLVICAHNDFGDLVRNKLFRLDASEKLVPNKPTLDRGLLERFAQAERMVRRPALLLALETLDQPERGEIPGEAEDSPYIEWYLRGAEEEYAEFVLERNDVVRSPFQDYYDADVSIRPGAPSAQFKQRLMEGVLGRVRDGCAKRGVALFVLVVPSSVDLCPSFRMHVDPKKHPEWTPTRMTDAYAAILARLSIPFADLTPAFRAAKPELLYLGRADFHWNGAGAEIGARTSAEKLGELGLWPPSR